MNSHLDPFLEGLAMFDNNGGRVLFLYVVGADWGGKKEGNLFNMVCLRKAVLSPWCFSDRNGGVN